jgi:hypothetical protein
MFPGYNIELNDPTEPNVKEVKEFGYEIAKFLKVATLRDRAERMRNVAWPKAVAFYSHLMDAV